MAFPITLENQIKLQKNWEAICNLLLVTHVSHKLITRGILTQMELNDVLKERTRLKQTQKLLTLLLTKDNQCFECFQTCLQEDYSWLADGLSGTVVTGEDRETFTASLLEQCSLPQSPVCFEGRCDEVEDITQLLRNGGRLAIIQGFGGLGKTALATVIGLKFVSKFGIRSVMASLRNVSTELDIVSSLLLALKLDTDLDSEHSDPGKLLTKACQEIAQFGKKVLIILDNCETAMSIDTLDYFKRLLKMLNTNCRNVYLLCTSRDTIHLPNMETHVHHLEPLSDSESISLLRWYSPSLDSKEGNILGMKCGFRALLLHLVGCLLKQGCKAIDLVKELEYAVDFDEQLFGQLLGAELGDVHACINLAYKRLCLKEQVMYQVLAVFPSTFTGDDAFAIMSKEFQDITSVETQKLLQALLDMSILEYDHERRVFMMHSIIQAFAQHVTSAENNERFNLHFMHFMETCIDSLSSKDIREGMGHFVKQRDRFAKSIDIFGILKINSRQMFYSKMKKFAESLSVLHLNAHAHRCFKILLATLLEADNICNDAEVAYIHRMIGILHDRSGETSAAIENLSKAKEIYESLPDVSFEGEYYASILLLGIIYLANGNISEASTMFEKYLSIAPNSDSCRQFVVLLIGITKPAEMPRYLKQVIETTMHLTGITDVIEECIQGDTCDENLDTMSKIYEGTVYKICDADCTPVAIESTGVVFGKNDIWKFDKQGDAPCAQGDHVQDLSAVPTLEKMFGESRSTFTALPCTGPKMTGLRNEDGAVNAFQRALAVEGKISEEYHEKTKTSIHDVPYAISTLESHTKAPSTYRRVLWIMDQILRGCQNIASTLQNVGNKMIELGNPINAADALRTALSTEEMLLGKYHEQTTTAIHLLARAISSVGCHADALSLYQRALFTKEQVLGDCSSTAATLSCIGLEKFNLGDAGGAVDAFRRSLSIREKIVGERHTKAAATMFFLARALSAQGNHVEALSTYQRALRIYEEIPVESRSISAILLCMAQEMTQLGKADDAVNALRKAIAVEEGILGESHEKTAPIMFVLALALTTQGNHIEAISIFQHALEKQNQVPCEIIHTAIHRVREWIMRMSEDKVSFHVTKELVEEMKSTKGVVAVGRWGEYLQVHLFDDGAPTTSTSDDQIHQLLQKYGIPRDKVLIVRQSKRPRVVLYGDVPGPGSKIRSHEDHKRYGTLGAYASSSTDPNSGFVLTCNHVTQNFTEICMAPVADGPEVMREDEASGTCACIKGECVLSLETGNGSTVDLSIVKFNAVKKKRQSAVARETTHDKNSLSRKRVFKLGATTGKTTGNIIGLEYCVFEERKAFENLILILPDSSCRSTGFSQKGDSGSVVYLESNSKLVSMVIGEVQDFPYNDIVIENGLPVTASFSIKDGLAAASAKGKGQWSIFDHTAFECDFKRQCPKPGSGITLRSSTPVE